MRLYTIFIFLTTATSLYSQVEVADSIYLGDSASKKANSVGKEMVLKENWFKIDIEKAARPDFMSADWKINQQGEYELMMPSSREFLYPPQHEEFATSYPFIYDYGLYTYRELSRKLYITSASEQKTYPTMGTVRMINGSLNYDLTNWLTISGGTYMSKYSMHGNLYRDIGANGAMRFYIGDRVRINTFGQYSVYGKSNGVGHYESGMFPQTHYGGSLEYKVNDKFGVEAGVVRELDPFSGKWKNRPYAAPVFYYGKKR